MLSLSLILTHLTSFSHLEIFCQHHHPLFSGSKLNDFVVAMMYLFIYFWFGFLFPQNPIILLSKLYTVQYLFFFLKLSGLIFGGLF